MADTTWDLRTEPLLTVDTSTGRRPVSLAGALAGLDSGALTAFQGLRPHQQHAWYACLCQLAALARVRAGGDLLGWSEVAWEDALLTLSRGEPSAWCLVVNDLARPAFFQSPVPEGNLDALKNRSTEPDVLDILVTAKNHDVKTARVGVPTPEQWACALVTVQTSEGYGGAGTYGIARMNGGFSSRPCVAVRAGPDLPSRFRRDVRVLVQEHGHVADTSGYTLGGDALLWLTPWDGTTSQALAELDPWFIEICRRIRLRIDGDRVVASTGTSKTARLLGKDRKGYTGDPWTPVRKADLAALTVAKTGFHYKRAQELILGADWEPGIAGRLRQDDPHPVAFLMQALVRGQGKTEGLHERVIPLPPYVRARLLAPAERDRTASRARARVAEAADVSTKALRPALLMLLQGGPDKLKADDDRANAWLADFDQEVDAVFFERLWDDLESDEEIAQQGWRSELSRLARAQLERAIQGCPIPATRRWRAIASAERVLGGALRKLHPVIEEQEDDHDHA